MLPNVIQSRGPNVYTMGQQHRILFNKMKIMKFYSSTNSRMNELFYEKKLTNISEKKINTFCCLPDINNFCHHTSTAECVI